MHNDICAKRLLSIDCGGNETRGVRHHRTVTKEHQINTSVNEINLPIHARSPTVTGQKHPATSLSYLCLFNVCSRFRCSAFFVFWQWSEGTKRRKRFIKVQNFAWLSRGTAFRGNRTWPAFDPGADPGGATPWVKRRFDFQFGIQNSRHKAISSSSIVLSQVLWSSSLLQ